MVSFRGSLFPITAIAATAMYLLASGEAASHAAGRHTVSVMKALIVTVPSDMLMGRLVLPRWLAWQPYVFYALGNERPAVTVRIDILDDPDGFFDTFRGSQKFDLNGMHAWWKATGAYVRFDVKLPQPKGCRANAGAWALVIYPLRDAQAKRVALSIRPMHPFPCLNGPVP